MSPKGTKVPSNYAEAIGSCYLYPGVYMNEGIFIIVKVAQLQKGHH
jgi:hypothetical protein